MSPFPDDVIELATGVLAGCRARTWRLATAESCTGGLVAAALTEIAGSSDVFDRGFVTYSNAAKHELLAVAQDPLERFGAVSAEVARAMAQGALAASRADLAVAITGVAGPGGGGPDKPVGLVHFATAVRGGEVIAHEERYGELGRSAVRLASLRTALRLFQARLG